MKINMVKQRGQIVTKTYIRKVVFCMLLALGTLANAKELITIEDHLEYLADDSLSKEDKKVALMTLTNALLHSDSLELQRKAVELLCVEGLSDKYGHGISSYFLGKFGKYDLSCFSSVSKQLIISYLEQYPSKLWAGGMSVVQKIGDDRFDDQLYSIADKFYSSNQPLRVGTKEWGAMNILARRGDPKAIELIVSTVKREFSEDNDRDILIMDRIKYMRQDEAIQIYYNYLMSEERLPPIEPCGGGGTPMQNRKVATEAVWHLADLLEGFPVEKRRVPQFYGPASVEIARKWMKTKNRDWQIKKQIKPNKN